MIIHGNNIFNLDKNKNEDYMIWSRGFLDYFFIKSYIQNRIKNKYIINYFDILNKNIRFDFLT